MTESDNSTPAGSAFFTCSSCAGSGFSSEGSSVSCFTNCASFLFAASCDAARGGEVVKLIRSADWRFVCKERRKSEVDPPPLILEAIEGEDEGEGEEDP